MTWLVINIIVYIRMGKDEFSFSRNIIRRIEKLKDNLWKRVGIKLANRFGIQTFIHHNSEGVSLEPERNKEFTVCLRSARLLRLRILLTGV